MEPALDAYAEGWIASSTEPKNDRALYTLYMLERAGVAGGIKRFGDHVWYERSTQFLLSRQNPQGGWNRGVDDNQADEAITTAFAMLTLSYARAPVAVTSGSLNF